MGENLNRAPPNLRVLRLFGQGLVKQCKPLRSCQSKNIIFFELSSVSTSDLPLAKEPEDSWYVIEDYHETNPASVHRADSDHGLPDNKLGHTSLPGRPYIQLLLSNIIFSQKTALKWHLNSSFERVRKGS